MTIATTIPIWQPVRAGYAQVFGGSAIIARIVLLAWGVDAAVTTLAGWPQGGQGEAALRFLVVLVDTYLVTCAALSAARAIDGEPRLGWVLRGADWQVFALVLLVTALTEFAMDPNDVTNNRVFGAFLILLANFAMVRLSLAIPLAAYRHASPLAEAWHGGRGSFFWLLTLFILTSAPSAAAWLVSIALAAPPAWVVVVASLGDYLTSVVWAVALADTVRRAAAPIRE